MNEKLCILCRGRMFCGKKCRAMNYEVRVLNSTEIFGSSPPSIFVGRANYPEVRVSAAVPPVVGNTSLYDTPELWRDLRIEDVLQFRYSLVLGNFRANVKNPGSSVAEKLQEICLYDKPVDIEVLLEKPPKPRVIFDEHHAPFGPSAPAKSLRIYSTPRSNKVVEEVYEARDLVAVEAIKMLYEEGIPVSHIQKLLSAGALGRKRKLVPTRWAITAVDDTISKVIMKKVKGFEILDSYRVFMLNEKRNLFMAILLPRHWSFEWGEAWFPETTWNFGKSIAMESDYEDYNGRESYAKIGGCYYAARLATVEYLERIRRQATAIIWREIYPGFRVPIGVWFVREMLRKMFSQKYFEFETLEDAIEYLKSFSKLIPQWLQQSALLRKVKEQRTLCQFL
ncbi:MAG: Nre family DNA repair protein [Archaeoglobaceae archaeon]